MARKSTPNALHCYNCNADVSKLRVSNDVVKRKRMRRKDTEPHVYDQVAVDCKNCGHQWYSMHPDALALSRKADKNIARRHKND